MAQFFDDFGAYTVGTVANNSAVDAVANWTVISPLDAFRAWEIKADAASPGGKYLEARDNAGGDAVAFMQFDTPGTLPAATALEWLFEVELTSLAANNTVAKLIYSGGNYYALEVFTNGSARLDYYQGTSPWSSVGSADPTPDRATGTPAALTTGKKYRFKVRRTAANQWSWKCWAPADGAEPAGWSVGDGGAGGVADSNVTTGQTGVGFRVVNSVINYGYFAVATAGDSAPEPGGSAPSISNVDGDDTVFEGQTSVQVNYTGGDASGNVVTISPTDNVADGNAVTPTISAENATQITLSAVNFPTGVAEGGTAYVFVTSTGGTNASGHAITRLDITAPLLSSGTATGVTPTAATPQVTTNEAAGQAWYVIVPSAEGTPSGTQIKAGQNAAGGSPVASGTVNPVSGTTVTFTEVTGLTPSTSYKICFYQEDDATPTPNGSNVTTHTFSTAALPSITTQALRQNNGTLLASQTGITADVYNTSTGALVVRKTGLSSDGSGVVTFSDAALSAATEYKVTLEYDTGGGVMADGVARITTA